MTTQDYESEVKRVYPDAKLMDNETDEHYANVEWISDGHGNDISDDCDNWRKAWQSAYNKLNENKKGL